MLGGLGTQVIYEQRAATVLFNFLKSINVPKVFLLPANVCPIVPLVFLKAGQPFAFVDISAETLSIDESAVLARLSADPELYAGVLMVHTYGLIRPTELFFAEIKKIRESFLIIDDRCLACPDFKASCGPYTDLVLYSSGYAKVVDVGGGGFGFLREGLPYVHHPCPFRESDLRMVTASYKTAIESGTRYHFEDSDWLVATPPATSFASYRQRVESQIAGVMAGKARINAIYAERLPAALQLAEGYHSWRFNIRVPHKERLLFSLFAAGLFASSHYASLAGIFAPGEARQAEKLQGEVVNLFNDRYFDDARAEKTVEIVNVHLHDFGGD